MSNLPLLAKAGALALVFQAFCAEDYFGCLCEEAPNIGEEGKVSFWSKSEGMIWIWQP